MVIVQVKDVPEHAPLHPVKVDPVLALAVTVTVSYLLKLCEALEHIGPQLMPPGELVTVPFPRPLLVTVIVDFLPRLA